MKAPLPALPCVAAERSVMSSWKSSMYWFMAAI
jgi:hypothetical protein